MKRFKVEGWYRYNDEKDFEVLNMQNDNAKDALREFKIIYHRHNFYKIDIIEL